MIAQWREVRLTPLHWAFVLFVTYALISLSWAPKIEWWSLFNFAVFVSGFVLGTTLPERPLLKWVLIASLIAFVVAYTQSYITINPMLLGEAAAILILVAIMEGHWWAVPPLALPLILSHSRGAWAALALGIFACYVRRPLVILLLILAGATALSWAPGINDQLRLSIWHAAWMYLTPLGNGLGSFLSLWIGEGPLLHHPLNVHNDYLQLVFELGIGALPLLLLFLCAFTNPYERLWPVSVAFLFMAGFSFPLYTPITALIGAVAFGALARMEIPDEEAYPGFDAAWAHRPSTSPAIGSGPSDPSPSSNSGYRRS